ncbi:MAG TPA: amidohydrolase family protein [Conexibacter sp.]|nr:amidohydrolase family protein [Conexibacter sp.]
MLDVVVRRARLKNGDVVDIGIEGERIAALGAVVEGEARLELDAAEQLVLPGFANIHLHLDKVLTAMQLPPWPDGTFQESIDLTLDLRRQYTHEDLLRRGRLVLDRCIRYGTSAVRAVADVGTVGGLLPAQVLCELRDEYRGRIEVQVCAFPQEGLIRDPGADELLVQAMEEVGCDVVGSFPWFELCHEHAQQHVDFTFELARRLDRDLHAFVDDEPIAPHTRNLEQLALATLKHGWEGRVSASHACGIASYDDFGAERLIRLVAQAGITISSNAHVSLVSKCQHAPEPVPRGITRVRELIAHGVNVTCAQDDVADPYYPFGRGDMLEVASFLAHTAHLYRPGDVEYVLDAITVGAAKGMRLDDYGLEVGKRADLVVFEEGDTATELLRLQPARRWVLHGGRVVAETRTETTLAGAAAAR